MRDVLKFDEVDIILACSAGGLDMLTVIPQDEVVQFGIPCLCKFYEFGVDDAKKKNGMLFGHILRCSGFLSWTAGMFMGWMVT